MTMTPDEEKQIQEIQERRNKIEPGNWHSNITIKPPGCRSPVLISTDAEGGYTFASISGDARTGTARNTASFIVHTPKDIDFLLTQLSAAQKQATDANKLAADRLEGLMPMKKLADVWDKDGIHTPASYHVCKVPDKHYITYGQCKIAKRLVDAAKEGGG